MVGAISILPPQGRISRRPKHKFQLRTKPYQLVPFMIAPVLPAETLESVWMEAREVTDPIKNPIIGWSTEWWIFYVKIRDLNQRDTLDDLFINPTASVSSLNGAAGVAWYHSGGAPNYSNMCMERVVQTYFRDQGEAPFDALIGSYPAAQYRDQGWLDSVIDTNTLAAGSGDPGASTNPEQLDKLMDAYEYLRSMQLTQMTFEDYCRTFGINLAVDKPHTPELLWHGTDWSYPSNTVDPTTGTPSSAVSWVVKNSSREKKLFKEPGFIFGVHTVRPKIYFDNQEGSLASYLDTGLSWLPAIMADAPETSLREFATGAGVGPLGATPTNAYWVDMRDLFLYGDQFLNFEPDGATNSVALPTAALGRKYPSEADMDALFVGETAKFARSDGFVSMSIKGTQVDYTGGGNRVVA